MDAKIDDWVNLFISRFSGQEKEEVTKLTIPTKESHKQQLFLAMLYDMGIVKEKIFTLSPPSPERLQRYTHKVRELRNFIQPEEQNQLMSNPIPATGVASA